MTSFVRNLVHSEALLVEYVCGSKMGQQSPQTNSIFWLTLDEARSREYIISKFSKDWTYQYLLDTVIHTIAYRRVVEHVLGPSFRSSQFSLHITLPESGRPVQVSSLASHANGQL